MKDDVIRCIAYRDDGKICGQPADHLDKQRGGMVCAEHATQAKEYHICAEFHATVRNYTTFTLVASSPEEARQKALEMVREAHGENTDEFQWEAEELDWDGDYHVEVGEEV